MQTVLGVVPELPNTMEARGEATGVRVTWGLPEIVSERVVILSRQGASRRFCDDARGVMKRSSVKDREQRTKSAASRVDCSGAEK